MSTALDVQLINHLNKASKAIISLSVRSIMEHADISF